MKQAAPAETRDRRTASLGRRRSSNGRGTFASAGNLADSATIMNASPSVQMLSQTGAEIQRSSSVQRLASLGVELGQRASGRIDHVGANGTIQRAAAVEKFGSLWKKGPLVDDQNPATRGRNANLHIKVAAIFSKRDGNDPADAEYRQYVRDRWEVTNPAHRRGIIAQSDWHDDGYSKADDVGGGADPALLRVQDFPGLHHSNEKQDGLLPGDDLTATFSARQQIIDTSNDDAVIADLGEHTATITGVHPRTFTGVPATIGVQG